MISQRTKQAPDDDFSGKRERTKAANREAILDAARMVFAELGFEATTVRDIIRRTDLASGTFYNYFKSKEEVFEALSRVSVLRFRPLLQAVRENTDTFEAYLHGAITAFFRYLAASSREGGSMRMEAKNELIGFRVDTPEMQAIFDEIRKDIEDILGKPDEAGIDTEYLTAAAIGLAREIGDKMIARLESGMDPDEEIKTAADFACNLILNGVRTQVDVAVDA